ncbi:hypothetical protein [Halobellus ruber]|uniref:Exo-alpha-sialidase n=1 Tax=Halobellus ruber TaxID=2761102 RepID=A0A7J9SKH6_9EURY|nr:hypothetical protein [Halobellus ruber]MBB6647435.1 hypothetical protein [Halobellus ruber]
MPTRRRALLLGATAAVGVVGQRSRDHTHAALSDDSDVIDRFDPTWRTMADSPWGVRWEVEIEGRPEIAAETARGSVVVAGTRSGDEDSPTWLAEIDSEGSVRVDRMVRDDPVTGPPSAVLPTAGGTLLGGHDGDDAAWIVSLSEEGEPRWSRRYRPDGGSGWSPLALVPTIRSSDAAAYTLVSKRESSNDWRDSAWLLQFGSDGDIRWNRTYDADVPSLDAVYAPDGSTFLLAGQLAGPGVDGSAGVLAIDNGGVAWRRTYPAYWFSDVAPASDDASGFVAVGHIDRGDSDSVGVVARLGAGGSVNWWRTLASEDDPVACNGVRSTPRGYLIGGLVRRGERDDAPFVGTLDPDGDRDQWYLFDGSRSVWPLFASDRPLSVEETEDGSVIRAFGGI